MATAAELQRQIAEAQAAQDDAMRDFQLAEREQIEAKERQSLRRDLESTNERTSILRRAAELIRQQNDSIDRDEEGLHMEQPALHKLQRHSRLEEKLKKLAVDGPGTTEAEVETVSFGTTVESTSFTWQIRGFKWLSSTLQVNGEPFVESNLFAVGDKAFTLMYSPTRRCRKGRCRRMASLAICILGPPTRDVSLLYRMYVRDRQGEFQPWGQEASVVLEADEIEDNGIFGPDVWDPTDGYDSEAGTRGVFSLCHEDLLASDWVKDDTLVVRVDLEVKSLANDMTYDDPAAKVAVRCPPTLVDDLTRLLDEGVGSDVVFIVDGNQIKAHSQILLVRSAAFSGLLSSGLRESIAREIVIEDCDAASFRAFLKFLYTEDFDRIKLRQESRAAQASSSGEAVVPAEGGQEKGGAGGASPEALLAMSHKYQVPRLQQWSEQQLLSRLTVANVCLVLRQAHLYEASGLEDACLRFIKSRFTEVVLTEEYGDLNESWPELSLKINVFLAGASKEDMKKALEKHRGWSGKRKRDA